MKFLIVILFLFADLYTLSAQVQISYSHDAAKQNQVTVMETGTGTLTPAFYYWIFHNKYRKNAAVRNKLGYRSSAGLGRYKQVDYAEQIDSTLTKRAKIEALNVADRTLDLAWKTESSNVNSSLDRFHKNIERILLFGGTLEASQRWGQYYDMYKTAIRVVRKGYMPNAQRKKEYLRICSEMEHQNQILVNYLVQLRSSGRTADLLEAHNPVRVDKSGIVGSALLRWKAAGTSTGEGN